MRFSRTIFPVLSAAFLALGVYAGSPAFADSDERGERGERRERQERGEKGEGQRRTFKTPESAIYKQECSECHTLFLPGLLPANSWEAVMKETEKHFGEKLGLDENTKAEILKYLVANSSEKTPTEWGRKITKSAKPGTTRITEVPWIVKEHRKIKEEVYKRASIGSKSNCTACHRGAAQGDFEEDSVVVPQK